MWVASRIINIFEVAPECLDIPCLFWHEGHTKSFACKKEVSQSGGRLRSSQLGVGLRSRKSYPGHEAVKTMTRWVSIFGSFVGFSQNSRNSHDKMLKSANFTFLCLQF